MGANNRLRQRVVSAAALQAMKDIAAENGGTPESDIRTIVVPAGQSFRIVDDADNPKRVFRIANQDQTLDGSSFALSASSGDGDIGVQFLIAQVVDTDDPAYGLAQLALSASNQSGASGITIVLQADGSSEAELSSQVVKFKDIPTHADNAAALAAGLPVGADYNTPAGVRMVVIPGV